MPDNTMVRATTPAGARVDIKDWPLADDAGATVRVAVAQTQLQHCVQGASGLEDGAALELRLEPNHRGVKGVSFAVHDAATGDHLFYFGCFAVACAALICLMVRNKLVVEDLSWRDII